ncbi:MAG: nitrous oxide reductase accessory protein NosL [Bacteroidetes bacterium]|nr:nitrous oxide reductase accessory protein NosL [Bacteroidota bacterium]
MKNFTRIIVLIISLSLIVSYFVPMWYIDLDAPQYPEGLGMKIWLNKMSGDLNRINGLNHYIGMKKIYPDAIPELKIMPYLIGLLIVGGLVVVFVRKKWLYMSWASFFVIIGIIGLMDFYSWEYDYGHNLDPHAAIKVPGMNYQPPVLGSKQLLNFTAYSYPDIGGTIIMGSALLALLFVFVELKKVRVVQKIKKANHHRNFFSTIMHKSAAVMLLAFFLTSCSIEPQPIQYGKEQCVFCKMTIADSRFGCELLTKKGKAYKFDSNECMINYIVKNKIGEETIYTLLTTDFSSPGKFVNAESAFFIIDSAFQSPMGANLAAFAEKKSTGQFHAKYDGKFLSWEQTFQQVSEKN